MRIEVTPQLVDRRREIDDLRDRPSRLATADEQCEHGERTSHAASMARPMRVYVSEAL